MIDIICAIVDLLLLIMYFNAIFQKRKTAVPFPLFLLCFLFAEGILYFFSLYFSYNSEGGQFYLLVLISILLTFLQTFFYESKLTHRIFAVISFQVYGSMAETIIFLLVSLLPDDMAGKILANNPICAIMSKLFLFFFVVITNMIFLRKKRDVSIQYTLLVAFMPIISLFILQTIPGQIADDSSSMTMCIIGAVGLLAANMVNYYLLDNILRVKELEQTKEQLNRQLDFQANKYQQISTAYRNTRSLMHDTKKHYFYIENCIKEKKYEDIEEYLHTSMQRIEQSYNRINTGNLVLDAFVSNHLSIAEKENIEFRTDIQVQPSNIQIDDYDLSIIMGNLLDNSLEACRQIQIPAPRQIEVEIHTTNKELVIHIDNTISKNSEKHKKDELKHGYGTTNIEKITLQYYGTYIHYIDNNRYHAIVSIPCNIA